MRRASSMTMDRTSEAVRHRPGVQARLLPTPFPPITLHLNTHYKRCPKALRLCLRSDQSPSRPLHGRSPDKTRHALFRGHSQVRAALTRRKGFAPSGDAPEHGVIVLPRAIAPPWATAPFSDSPGAALAGQSEQSDNPRLKTNAPFKDSTVVTIGELRSTNAGLGSPLPSLRMVEHFWWTRLPRTENFSGLVHILSEVRGKDSTVVTIGELRSTNGGHGSPLPSLGMVEHFWCTGLPHTENLSGPVHIPSEVRGCRRVVADVNRPQGRTPRIGTGVDAFSRNRPGPSITSPNKSKQSLNPMNHSADGNAPCSTANHPPGEPVRLRRIIPNSHQAISGPSALGGRPLEESAPSPSRGSSGGWSTTANSSHPSPTTHERTPPTTPYPHNLLCPIQRKRGFPAKQSKFMPESAHQSKTPARRPNRIINLERPLPLSHPMPQRRPPASP